MKPDQNIDPTGTSFHGVYLKCSLKKLAAAMGEPIDRFCYKINYEWRGTTDDGHIFTVYDWKRPRPQTNQLVEWHIGGKTKEATEQAKEEILRKIWLSDS
jgi:hypothetical protein